MKARRPSHRFQFAVAALSLCLVSAAASGAEPKKDFRYTVGPHSTITIVNANGGMTVRPSTGRQVVISTTSSSDHLEVDSSQNGNRIQARTHALPGGQPDAKVEYDIQVPADAGVTLRGGSGAVKVENLAGELDIDSDAGSVDVKNVTSTGHVHVRTLNGNVSLTNVKGHIEIASVGGQVTLNEVSGSLVSVNTTKGAISFSGDPGADGSYRFVTNSGNVDVALPASASVDMTARSVTGSVEKDFPLQEKTHTSFVPAQGRSFAGTSNSGSSTVELRSISGKIRVKKQ